MVFQTRDGQGAESVHALRDRSVRVRGEKPGVGGTEVRHRLAGVQVRRRVCAGRGRGRGLPRYERSIYGCAGEVEFGVPSAEEVNIWDGERKGQCLNPEWKETEFMYSHVANANRLQHWHLQFRVRNQGSWKILNDSSSSLHLNSTLNGGSFTPRSIRSRPAWNDQHLDTSPRPIFDNLRRIKPPACVRPW